MKKRVSGVVLSAAMLASSVLPAVAAGMPAATAKLTGAPAALSSELSSSLPLQAWYDEPAEMTHTGWEQHGTQLGNGFIGAMVFGGVATDKIQVNEHTLWSGGPGASADYDGGVKGTAEEHHATLQEVREALQKVDKAFSDYVNSTPNYDGKKSYDDFFRAAGVNKADIDAKVKSLFGEKTNFGSYQTLGNIYIKDINNNDYGKNYRRTLDLNKGMATVTYTQGGVDYTREYFTNNPDNVMVIRLTASKPGMLNRDITIDSEQTNKSIAGDVKNNTITMVGQPADHTQEEHLEFAQQLKVVAKGGNVFTIGDTASVTGADEIVIYMTAGTNYQQCMDDSYDYFKDEAPLAEVSARLNAAVEKGYDKLLENHLEDYQALFNAMQLNIYGAKAMPTKPTDELIQSYRNKFAGKEYTNTEDEDRYLENLYFQFGRYLLIASSREGSLPANLQGIWADSLNPPWSADYHTNINLQMNYWLAESTNLSECHLPVIDYINAQVPRGEEIAKNYYITEDGEEVRGWTIHHECNIWGNAAPGESGASYAPESAAWMCEDIWEYYQFNQDKEFLAANYDTLLQAALFWVDNLVVDQTDGTLVASPSYSPEHGPFVQGTTFVQTIVWEIFNEVIQASEILNKPSAEVEEIKAALEKLYIPTAENRIGVNGQFMEWKYETNEDVTGGGQHRHTNHLYAVHPSNLVVVGRSENDDLMAEAMKETLNVRTDNGTGWSKAWKVNFWARLRDGDRSHKVLESLLGGYDQGGNNPTTADNLFDMHAPFQIDGNFGATSGVAEMLLQSQGDAVELLAALPSIWAEGAVTGMKARGNIEVDMDWHHGELSGAVLRPAVANDALKVKGQNIANAKLTDSKGNQVAFTADGANTIVFAAKAGETYTISDITDVEGLENAKTELEELVANATVAYEAKKPTDELYDAPANAALKAAIDSAAAVLASSNDKFALMDAIDGLTEALADFESAYDLSLTVSLQGGLYSGTQIVKLLNDSSIIDIRYTLDGTTPTKDSDLYLLPIVLPYGASNLRAAAFYGDKMVGDVAAEDYLLTPTTDVAKGATTTITSTDPTISGYPVDRITNGNTGDRWATSSNAGTDLVVEIDLKKSVTFDSFLLDEFTENRETTRVNSLKLEYLDGSTWKEITADRYDVDHVAGTELPKSQRAYKSGTFASVTAQKVRLTMRGGNISIYGFSLYNSTALGDKTELNALIAEYEQIDLTLYENPAIFAQMLDEAKAVAKDGAATESDVVVALTNLKNAKELLVEKDSRLLGDVDNNGEVTAADALLILQAATKKITLDDEQIAVADVDGVEGVSASDALMILQAATKKITLGDSSTTPPDDEEPEPPAPPVTLPTATKAELEAVMAAEIDSGRYTETSYAAYVSAMDACQYLLTQDNVSGINYYRAKVALENALAGLTENVQANWIGTFTKINGKATALSSTSNQIYADWKSIDQGSLDATALGRENLALQFSIQYYSDNPNVDPTQIVDMVYIKLRSSDKSGVAGDTDATNTEHNYGWDFYADARGSATLNFSIPLNKLNTNKRGVMDWTDIQRLIIVTNMNTSVCTGNRQQYYMVISGARIVDMTQMSAAQTALTTEINRVKDVATAGKDAALVEAFNKALANAQAMAIAKNDAVSKTESIYSLYDVQKAQKDLTAAYDALIK